MTDDAKCEVCGGDGIDYSQTAVQRFKSVGNLSRCLACDGTGLAAFALPETPETEA